MQNMNSKTSLMPSFRLRKVADGLKACPSAPPVTGSRGCCCHLDIPQAKTASCGTMCFTEETLWPSEPYRGPLLNCDGTLSDHSCHHQLNTSDHSATPGFIPLRTHSSFGPRRPRPWSVCTRHHLTFPDKDVRSPVPSLVVEPLNKRIVYCKFNSHTITRAPRSA